MVQTVDNVRQASSIDEQAPIETHIESVAEQLIESSDNISLFRSRRSSQWTSPDSCTTASSGDSTSNSSFVRVVGSLSVARCERFCPCQCHMRSSIRTPEWTRNLLGSMVLHSNTSVSLNRRPCNEPLCKRSGDASIQVSYIAPAWWFLGRVGVQVKAQSIRGLPSFFLFVRHA